MRLMSISRLRLVCAFLILAVESGCLSREVMIGRLYRRASVDDVGLSVPEEIDNPYLAVADATVYIVDGADRAVESVSDERGEFTIHSDFWAEFAKGRKRKYVITKKGFEPLAFEFAPQNRIQEKRFVILKERLSPFAPAELERRRAMYEHLKRAESALNRRQADLKALAYRFGAEKNVRDEWAARVVRTKIPLAQAFPVGPSVPYDVMQKMAGSERQAVDNFIASVPELTLAKSEDVDPLVAEVPRLGEELRTYTLSLLGQLGMDESCGLPLDKSEYDVKKAGENFQAALLPIPLGTLWNELVTLERLKKPVVATDAGPAVEDLLTYRRDRLFEYVHRWEDLAHRTGAAASYRELLSARSRFALVALDRLRAKERLLPPLDAKAYFANEFEKCIVMLDLNLIRQKLFLHGRDDARLRTLEGYARIQSAYLGALKAEARRMAQPSEGIEKRIATAARELALFERHTELAEKILMGESLEFEGLVTAAAVNRYRLAFFAHYALFRQYLRDVSVIGRFGLPARMEALREWLNAKRLARLPAAEFERIVQEIDLLQAEINQAVPNPPTDFFKNLLEAIPLN